MEGKSPVTAGGVGLFLVVKSWNRVHGFTFVLLWLLIFLYCGLPRWRQVVKNLPASAEDIIRDVDLIPGSGKSPGGGTGTHSSILAWRILWSEEPGRLRSIGFQRVGHD